MTSLTDSQLLKLARDAYNATSNPDWVPDGFEEISINLDELKDGERIYDPAFSARSYYNPTTNELVMAPTGSDDATDFLREDPGYVFGYLIPQFESADKYFDAVLDKVGKNYDTTLTKDDITLTGHSHADGLSSMLSIYKGAQFGVSEGLHMVGFDGPGISRQLDNLEEYDDKKGDLIKTGDLTNRDLSSFTNIRHIVLKGDFVHLAGEHVGSVQEIDAKNTVLGTAITTILGAAGGALLAGPVGAVGGILGGLFTKYFANGVREHLGGTMQEAIDNQTVPETTFEKFLSVVGSIDSYINQGTSSVVDLVNKGIDWMTNVVSDLTGAAKDAWNGTVNFFDGLFDGHDGAAPTNADGTVNNSAINNSLLDLTINTDKLQGFATNQDQTQTGNVIDGGDYSISGPIENINGDGIVNVAPWLIAGDGYRPGNQELSSYSNFSTELNADFAKLDQLSAQLNQQQNQPQPNLPDVSKLNLQLQNPLANLTNNSINARTFLNIDPVVLDLNGDGVKLTSYNSSEVTFDVDNDGKQERTGWVSNQDGILVEDVNQDGKINNITETISEYYNPNDGSIADADGKYSGDGLAALKKLDSNNDGKFNNQDAKWNDLRVWTDTNSDAQTDAGELKTLDEAGIKEFDLTNIIQANKERNEGNVILAKSTYTTTDNQTKQVAAVDFTTNPIGYEFNDVNLGKLATAEDGTKSLVISNPNGETVVASEEIGQNIFGNIGNDNITGDDRDNWISGGAGSDTLKGGKGDDILIIDSEDKQENIDGGEGRDIVIINSDKGVSFNLTQSRIETAVGGNGDDILIGGGTSNVFIDGGSGDDIIIGGAADDALAGSDGNDYVDGGYGDDVIRGHRGNDVLIGGEGNDYLEGGLDDDKIFAGVGNDVIMEGQGNDEIDGGEGYDLVKYQGSYKDYKISRDGANYKIQDLKTGNIDSVKNIEGVRFADVTIKLIDGNISPMPVADLITLQNKSDTVFITKDDLLKNDLDVDGDSLTMISVQNSVGGAARLVKDNNGSVLGVEFTPDKSFIGNMSFDYDIKDSKGAYTTIEQRNNDGSSVTAAMKARVTFKLASDPTDDLYAKQWYLSEINVQKAWQDYTGEGIKVGVFEKGDFNINHQDLDGNALQYYKDDVAFREVDQYSQHKTTVAGVIAAERNNGGIVGVAYNSKLDGYSWDADASGLDNLKNVDIANNSWGAIGKFADNFSDPNNPDKAYESLLKKSVQEGRNGLGTIDVFAGGNDRQEGDNVNYHSLQNSRFVITTGSINQPGDLATLTEAATPFSNPGDAILVSAPGSNINSTGNLLTNDNGSQFLGEFSASQGTSFSAPIISGVVALMLQANPNLGYRDVQKILALSARQFNDPNTSWQENGAENWNGGAMHFSHDYGFGIVDAAAAVRLAETWKEQSTYYNEKSLIAENNERIAIVDNDTVGKKFTIANSNMHNIETVEVEVNLSHLSLSDLTIKLVSPSGTTSILLDKPTNSVYEGGLTFNFSSRAFLGENVDGDWKLEITDSVTGNVGYLNSWKLKFYGELDDGKNDLYVYTDEFAKMTDGSRGIISDTDGGTDVINASAVSSDTTINLNSGKTSKIAGHDVLISGGTPGDEYYQKKALLPTKEAALAAKNSEVAAKNQTLSADNIELAGIDAVINAKYSEATSKYNEYLVAKKNVDDHWLSKNTYWFGYKDGATYYIFKNNLTGSQTALTKNDYDQRYNNYRALGATQNQKSSEYESLKLQYQSLVTRHDALPSEIANLKNEITGLSNQANSLQSEINFIKTYLNSFNENGASAIENAYTGDGNDTIIGSDLANEIWGGRGNNILTGNGGADIFVIKKNATTTDRITDFKPGEDKIDLTDFRNVSLSDLTITQNGANAEIRFISGQKIILENINAGQILTDSFTGIAEIQNLINGTSADDVLVGTNQGDLIKDSFGNDIIKALGGNDEIDAGMGNDKIFAGAGDDVIYGGRGNDLIYADGDLNSNGTVVGNDTRAGKNKIFGGDDDDTIFGGSGNDYIDGGDGNDTLYGGAGNDTIIVGAGNNQVQAGSGDDIIDLSGGNSAFGDRVNFISGGEGSDKFILDNGSSSWNEINVISDFDVNDPNEKIDLSKLTAVNKYSDLKILQQGANDQIIVISNFGKAQIIKLQNVDASKLTASKFIITNEAPRVTSDGASTQEDKRIVINITANDSDDKTDITRTKITVVQPTNGTVTINLDGTVTYTPKANFNGIDQFEYQLTDAGGLASEKAKVIVNIDPLNDAPVVTKIVSDQVFYSDRGISFKASDIFTEVDGEGLTYSAALSDGSALPSWISFNSSTQTFSGNSPSTSENFIIKLTATDDSGNSTSTNIKLKIDNGIIHGTDGNDVMAGTSGNDVIDGGKGDDVVSGGNGSDILFGGEGNDKIYSTGNSSNDTLTGDSGSDIFVIGNDIISNDIITDFDVSDPNEKIDLSNFAISKHGYSTLARIADLNITQVGNDAKIIFSNSSKTVTIKNVKVSDLTADKFILNNAPTINAAISDQKIFITKDFNLNFNSAFNDIDGDTLSYSAKLTDDSPLPDWLHFDSVTGNFSGQAPNSIAGLTIKLTAIDKYGLTSSTNFKLAVDDKIIFGTDGNDSIAGTSANEAIEGGKGDDVIDGGNGSDVILGGEGNDRIFGANSGNSNTLTGNSGSDTFIIKDGIISNDVITDFNVSDPNEKIDLTNFNNSTFSGAIRDVAQLSMAQVGSDVKITFNSSKTLTVKNIQLSQLTVDKFIGLTDNYNSAADLTVDGTYRDETLYGGKGDDIIKSNGGNDSIFAGAGNDKLYGGSGNTTFSGGTGSDTFVVQGNYGSDVITDFNVSDSNEKIDLSSFKDVATDLSQLIMDQIGLDTKISFNGKSKTILVKNVNKSVLTVDKFIGLTDNKSNPNNLVLNGTLSNDTLTGGIGDDIINGDRGNDIIKGNAGNNLLTGGAGTDTFIISKNPNKTDVITDFNVVDSLQLDGFTAGTKITDFTYSQEGSAVIFDLGEGQKLIFQNANSADLLFYLSFTTQINLSDASALISYTGTAANEKIVISTSNRDGDVINGGDGNDLLIGNNRDDTLNGGKGNDTLVGGDWSDIFEVNKNPGDKDTIVDLKIKDMVDSIVLKGFTDPNLASYSVTQVDNDAVIDLGDEQTLTLKNFKAEDVPYIASYSNKIYPSQTTTNGTDGDDLISRFDLGSFRGTAILNGGKGNDVLKGSKFDQDYFVIDKNSGDHDFVRSIDSSGGDKVILRGFGNDILDKIKFLPSSDQYTLIMDLGDGQILRTYGVTQSQFRQYFDVEKAINSTDGNDNLSAGYLGLSVDGGAGDDKITGNNWGNNLTGGDGNDTITAGSGNDTINGGNGNDKITTGAGNDVVDAGAGNDEINITSGGNKNITGGDGSDLYKISAFTGDITITDFAISDSNEKIDLKGISNIFSFSDLVISQTGRDAVIQLSSSQKIILKNTNKNLLTADKFVLYSNHFDGSPINDNLSGGDGNDFINGYGGNDSVSLNSKGSDAADLGNGNDSFSVSGNGYYGNDNVVGGAGNDKFFIDLGYSYGDANYTLTINDFEATNPNEKIYISNDLIPNVDFTKDLKINQIGDDVQISLSRSSNGKKLILKNVNKADLNENNIILPKVEYKYATQASQFDDNITYDPNAGTANAIGKDIKIPISGTVNGISTYADHNQTLISFYVVTDNGWVKQTLVNASVFVGQNLTTYTYNSFDPAKDRLGIDGSYAITKYSDLPLSQVGNDVVMNFADQKVKIVLKNVNLTDLQESDFIFYNHSTDGNDLINGGNGNDHLEGGKGNDQINGGAGNDEIYGGDGNDSLTDYAGVNKLYGGAGDDSLGVSMQNNSTSSNELYGGEGNDVIHFSTGGTNMAKGGIGNDEFIVYGGDNEIYGEEGVDDFIIGKSYSATFNGSDYVVSDADSSTTIHDFDPLTEKITLDGFDGESLDQFNIVQDGNDVVFNLSSVQTLRLNNVLKSSLNQDNIIIPDKHIQDSYYYTFDDRTNEYSISDLNKLMAENPGNFYQEPVAEIASSYDPVLMKTVSTFDVATDKIHLGKIKSLENFEDLKITQHSIAESYGSPSEFTLIDLGDGSFVKLIGFYNLTADNFVFNKAPIANFGTASIDEDGNQSFDVIAKTFDADDDSLQITNITNPSHGVASIVTDEQGKQKISYIPNVNFHGSDQLDYTVEDGRGGVVTKTINITVNSVNDLPVGGLESINLNEDASIAINLLEGVTDADGDTVTATINTAPTHGTLTENQDGTWQYNPNANFNGSDSFKYQLSDGNGGVIIKTVNVTVNSVNDAPVSNLVLASTDEDTKLIIDVLGQTSDADSDQLILSLKNSPTNGIATIIDVTTTDSDGNVITTKKIEYNPNSNFNGSDSLVYEISDGNGGVVDKTLNIEVNSVNDTPDASDIQISTNEDNAVAIDVLASSSDADSDQLSVAGIYGVTSGVANMVDGKILYTPDANYNGVASFNYVISDGNGGLNTKTVSVTVNAINDAPIANVSDASTNEDANTTIDVLSSASDADGDSLTLSLVGSPANGVAKIVDVVATDSDGNSVTIKKIEYNPNANFNGSDSLVYSLSDGKGGIVTKTLNITVNSINDAPVTANDTISLNEDNSVKISALANDSDIEDSSFEKNNIAIIAAALHGTVILNDDLTFTYNPDSNYFGTDSFSYQVKDKDGSFSNTANVYLNIASVNDAVAIDGVVESQNLAAGKFFSYDLSGLGFSDVDGDAINVGIKLTSGNDIPSWLSFNSETKILSGTPSDADAGSVALQLIASDGKTETIQKFDLAISKPITQNPNIAVNVITVSANNDPVSANKGTVDIVTGNDADNTFQYEQDDVWTDTNIVAWNPYTNDQFSVVGKVRSFDAFDGGGGNNTLNLTDSDDVFALDDLISSNPSESGSRLFGIKIINAKGGNDIIDLSSNRFTYGDVTINGSEGNDILWGNDGNDTINGDTGNDHIVGGRGDDILSGGDGNDTIKGYDGNDLLIGGKGADVMIGGAGNDQFIFTDLTHSTNSETDFILDFIRGEDQINLSSLGFDSITQGAGSNSSASGLEYYFDGSGNTVIDDPNSNFAVKLAGEIHLDQNDFSF
ncbi:MAG: hypothetical protein A2887_06025 [Alphaproteobacteria bacterium RIFCSPLOWO2_01_FULL_40_26]|nr:MAG: hypothetical protein A3D15_04335 [Alphaproteobacteria bacterium RIFCSPHIGHO2_02_FULL_40_34]OFW94111.1 MAG: hypothetical protein A2887_06025 [Alphaproteobacteria bacterium RIFCSPLOWO2_01_FULL_40_26]OFX09696.1 MAG: hypothetical protein A3H30_06650 [Alphaproteobacteria bacterium RIFCSPLOWO2_02_FULL_40_19]